MKQLIKRLTRYTGSPETYRLRELIKDRKRPDWPYAPEDQGDLLFKLARMSPSGAALQVGLATGSTAIYMLEGLGDGELTSIDFAQDDHDRSGVELVYAAGLQERHHLLEENSAIALPRIFSSGAKFDLIFLDGWKTFDHVWVDTFYSARLLKVGGYIVFDDSRMKAVQKSISILIRYYEFEVVKIYDQVGGFKEKIWHILSTRSLYQPYFALQKIKDISLTKPGSKFDWWEEF